MNDSKLTAFLLGKQYIGIEYFSLEKEDIVAILLVKKTREGLDIIQKDKVVHGELAEKWDKKLPFFLIVNSSQVIQKEIQGTEPSDEKLLHRAFPNLAWTEFYYEIFRMQSRSIVAISRKAHIHQLYEEYSNQKIAVAGISLGICALSEISNHTQGGLLLTNTQAFSLDHEEQTIKIRTEYSENTFDLNGLQVGSSHLLSFSGILKAVMGDASTSGSILEFNKQLRDSYNQKTFFARGMKIFVGTILTLLLVNFFVFNHFYKVATETSQNLASNKSSIETIRKVRERILGKEQKLKNTVEFTASKSAFVVNEIASRIPSSIVLSELAYNPLQKKVKEDEPVSVEDHTILVSGTTMDNDDFTSWVDALERLKFIAKVVILHFGKNEANETVFAIKIKLLEDEIR